MRTLAEALQSHVLLADAAIEDRLRALPVDPARDLFGAEGCLCVLSLTRARRVRELHEEQLCAGADVIRTNTAAASPLELRRFGLAEDAFAINYAAAELAVAAVDAVPGEGRRRFVLGVLRDLGWEASPHELEEAAAIQTAALIAGGADGIGIEGADGTCRAPALLRGALKAKAEAKSAVAILLIQNGRSLPESARKLADGVIRHRVVGVEDAAGYADALRSANLIGGASTEDTAALDRRLRSEAEESLRPSVTWAKAPPEGDRVSLLGVPASPPRSARAPLLPALAGTVIHCESRWRHRP